MQIKRERNSGIELLRIICMVFIIAHHYWVHGGYPELTYHHLSAGMIFVHMSGMFGRVANSIFMLISGYFLITSDTKNHYRKIVPLVGEMIFYSVIINVVYLLINPVPFVRGGVKGVIKSFLPFFYGNWFVVYYILLYLFVPFINPWLKSMSAKRYTVFVAMLICIWSIIHTIFWAYSFSNLDVFLIMYILGAYIRLHIHGKATYQNRWNLIVGITAAGITCLSVPVLSLISLITKNNYWLHQIDRFLREDSVINVICAVFIFMFFSNISFISHFVNEIAASIVGIYLLHDNDLVRSILWTSFWPNCDYMNFPYLHELAKVVGVFIVCFVIDYVRRKTVGKWFEHWFYGHCDCMVAWFHKTSIYLKKKILRKVL